MEQFLTGGGLQILAKLQFNSLEDVFVILPHNYSLHFTTSQIVNINNKTLYIDCVLMDYTCEGFPVLEFIYTGGAIA
jgi:hypothetical protein